MTTALLIFIGQFAYSFMRTLVVRQIAAGRRWQVVGLNAVGSLLRLLIMTGGITSVMNKNWLAVAVFVLAGAAGDFLGMGEKLKPKYK